MITQPGVVDQEIDIQSALVQPIAETLQVGLAPKVQGVLDKLKIRIARPQFGRQRLQAIRAPSHQDKFARYGRQLTCKLSADS
jgi:hypothetical protein